MLQMLAFTGLLVLSSTSGPVLSYTIEKLPLADVTCDLEIPKRVLSLDSIVNITATLKNSGPERHIWAEIGLGNGGFIMRARASGIKDKYLPDVDDSIHIDPNAYGRVGRYNTLPYKGVIGFQTDIRARDLFEKPGKYVVTMMYVAIAKRNLAPKEIQLDLIADDQPPIVCQGVEITVT